MTTNTINTAQLIARQTAEALVNELGVASMIHRDHAREFGPGKTGYTVDVRAPIYFRVQEGPTINWQAIEDRNIPLTINRNPTTGYPFTQNDATLKEDELAERFSMPAAKALANEIERSVLDEVLYASWNTTEPWTSAVPDTFEYKHVLGMTSRLTEAGTPNDGRIGAFNPQVRVQLANSLALLNATTGPSTDALRKGETGTLDNVRFFETNLIPTHTNGARATAGITIPTPAAVTYATATANNYTQTVGLAQTAADNATWLRKGEKITFAGCFAVNPITKQVYPHLRQFTVQQDAALSTNAASVVISPPMITSGPYQTVNALPSNGATVTVNGNASLSTTPAVVMHKNAITLATIPLVRPIGASFWGSKSYKGFTVNVMADFDVNNRESRIRFDVLMGLKVINPEMIAVSSGRKA